MECPMPGQRDLVIGTAGHIDHGKTALVQALTGVDTDRLPAEKQRGITIDLGFAALELDGRRVAMVDVPGHERFIRNMLAGASGLDLAMLIVAADDSVMPQTREHLEILQILGLAGGVVAITKCDLVDPGWLALVEDEIRALVSGTFLESAEIVRTSCVTGLGFEDLKASLARLCDASPDRADSGLFRMAIDRSFTVAGHGTIVTGTVASGQVAVGDDLEWLPAGRTVRVRGLHRHDRPVDTVARGARAAINLGGVHHAEVLRGHELATPGYLTASRIVAVEVHASDQADRPLKHRRRYRIHLGTAEVSATLALLDVDGPDPSGSRLAQLFLAQPVAAVHGQPFVIRSESPPETLGGGRVLHPSARHRIRRRDSSEIDRLKQLASREPIPRMAAALASFGLRAWTDRALCRDSGVPIGEVESAVKALAESGRLVTLPIGPRRTVRVLSEVVDELEGRVLRALGRLHAASPRFSAIARARVASSLADLENDSLVSALIDRLKASGRVIADARSVALVGHQPRLSQAERKLKEEMAQAYRLGGFTPPEPSEWLAKTGPKNSTVSDLLALLVDEEQIVEIAPGLHLDHEIELELRRRVSERLANGDAMTMAELRDLLGTSRKFAVPIGEYLDRIGWTHRVGDVRTLGDRALAAQPVEEGTPL
jgi:selenocysteine-specific elongation factor